MASVKMPQLGESITEGTISKWLKQPGDQVKKYEALVEVITDKVNAEIPAPLAGVLKEIKVKEGTTVTVGTEIAVIEESATATQRPAPAAPTAAAAQTHDSPSPLAGAGEGRTRLSPAVRALIEEHHITDAELARIDGSGVGGRISKKDIEDYVAKRASLENPESDIAALRQPGRLSWLSSAHRSRRRTSSGGAPNPSRQMVSSGRWRRKRDPRRPRRRGRPGSR